MQPPVETAKRNVGDVLALVKCLVARPENLTAIQLRGTDEIIVIERGTHGEEGELVAARLTLGAERRVALGRLTYRQGRTCWQSARAVPQWNAHDAQPGTIQVLGRVLSVIHPVSQNGEPQVA